MGLGTGLDRPRTASYKGMGLEGAGNGVGWGNMVGQGEWDRIGPETRSDKGIGQGQTGSGTRSDRVGNGVGQGREWGRTAGC